MPPLVSVRLPLIVAQFVSVVNCLAQGMLEYAPVSKDANHFLAVDIGGTKTLLGAFDSSGKIKKSFRFETSSDYAVFLSQLQKEFSENFREFNFSAGACAVPARLSDDKKIALGAGNLPWKDVPVHDDLSKALGIDVFVENDAKLAALSEAVYLKKYDKVLYLTISTGIGAGVIINGVIDEDFENIEPGQMIFEHNGELQRWEHFASGKAIVQRFGKKASEIEDVQTWKAISSNIALGLFDLLANVQPDVVVIGGGVGAHFDKFGNILEAELKALANSLVPVPPLVGAKHAEQAVIYGCYELLKQKLA